MNGEEIRFCYNEKIKYQEKFPNELRELVKSQCGNHLLRSMAEMLNLTSETLNKYAKKEGIYTADKKLNPNSQDYCHFCDIGVSESKIFSYLKFDNDVDMFQCSICNDWMSKRCNMIRHIKVNHRSEIISNTNTIAKQSDCGNSSCKKVYGLTRQRKKFGVHNALQLIKFQVPVKKD